MDSSIQHEAIHGSQLPGRRLDIQLTGKHLALLFMTTAVVSVGIFLGGVIFGRAQFRPALTRAESSTPVQTTTQPTPAPPARDAEVTALTSPAADADSDRLGKTGPSSEHLEAGAPKPDTALRRRRGAGRHRTRSHAASQRVPSGPSGQ